MIHGTEVFTLAVVHQKQTKGLEVEARTVEQGKH